LNPINVDFPFFVGNSSGLTPIKWREMLEFISPNIAFLSKDSNADDIGCALGAVVTFCCPLVLGSFMCFADSEYFDLESANRAIAFLNLFPKILVPEVIAKVITHEDCHDVDKCLRLLSDIREPLEQLVANLLPNRKPFLSVTELEVFHCVAASF
jgi:hypothetical protein